MKIVHGVLEDFFETGTEGVIWSVYEDGKTGYDGLNTIEEGDVLTIIGSDSKTLWTGIINPDYRIGWEPIPWVTQPHKPTVFCGKSRTCDNGHSREWARRKNMGQQVSCGRWVHWIQRGFSADDWGRMFFMENKLRAVLNKK